jgi:hypothetical protein
VIVEVARANPTDGTRMVAALASRELGRPVNRKRVQRVMRAQRLLQPSRSGERRRGPGFFRVTRPDELWHADMTKVWTAQHGWVYLHAIIDCCTRELVGWSLEVRCRDDEAIACVEAAVLDRGVGPAHSGHRQWQPVHLPRLPLPPVGPRDHPPTGRPTSPSQLYLNHSAVPCVRVYAEASHAAQLVSRPINVLIRPASRAFVSLPPAVLLTQFF